jgi:hypothetical protein
MLPKFWNNDSWCYYVIKTIIVRLTSLFQQLCNIFSSVLKKSFPLSPLLKKSLDTWFSEIVILEDNLMSDNLEIL